MRKPAFCLCENNVADQLRDSDAADRRLCFRYIQSAISNPSHLLWFYSPVCVEDRLCRDAAQNISFSLLKLPVMVTVKVSVFSSPEPKAHKVGL